MEKEQIHGTLRVDFLKARSKGTKARPAGDKTFVKFGKEINIQDFINSSAEQTAITTKIETAGGLDKLKAAGTESIDEVVTDRGMNFIQANKFLKVMAVKEKELKAKAEHDAAVKKAMEETLKEENNVSAN